MIIKIESDVNISNHIFFGLKSDGNYLFENNNSYQINFIDLYQEVKTNKTAQNNNIFSIAIDNKEYIISFINEEKYFELYDFDNNQIYKSQSIEIFGYNLKDIKQIFLKINNNLAFLSLSYNNTHNILMINELKFKSINIENETNIKVINTEKYFLNKNIYKINTIISSFVSKSNYIWIMALNKEFNLENIRTEYYIFIFNQGDKSALDFQEFQSSNSNKNNFLKMIHLRDDIGIIMYY